VAGFTLRQTFNAVSPAMIGPALVYPLRKAVGVVRSTQPELKGFAYLRAVWKELKAPRPNPPPVEAFIPFGAVQGLEGVDGRTVRVVMGEGTLQVRALTENLLQLRYRPDRLFGPPFSYSVERGEDAWPFESLAAEESPAQVEIRTGGLVLTMEKASGALALGDGTGRVFFSAGVGARHREGPQVTWQAQFPGETPFYGLGEKATGLNLAGKRFELWNSDPSVYERGDDPIYLSVPFVLGLVGGQAVGLFFDNTYRAWVDLGSQERGAFRYTAAGGELRLYVMTGTPAQVLERYTQLTGRMPLPPLWTFGLHQSRWSYYPQARVLEVAREFRKRRIPCDVIHLDIHYLDGYRSFTWDRKRFPDLKGMTDALHEQGFKALAMIDPGIKVDPGYPVYDEGMKQGYFLTYPDGSPFIGPVWPGNAVFPDFSNPRVRAWWGGLYRELLEQGLDAFWNDMNEPALTTAWKGKGHAPEVLVHDGDGRGADHAELHNVYGLLMARASVEGLAKLRPDRRPLILTRSGWAGVQRYAIHWTGDNKSTWDHLALTLPMVMNLGLSGIPMTGPDTGGFTGGPSPELYARWIQLGAFTPFFRIHSMAGSPDQEPWAFGEEVERISRRYIELRYQLLPYLYTAAWQASRSGLPIMRALAFAYPEDEATHSLDDQFLFGDGLLVAPVLEPGATRRKVYLPAGAWFDFWTGEMHLGPQTVEVPAPLEVLPLFVKGGAAIPFWPVQQYVGERVIDELELRLYWAAGDHTSFLYEDDGEHPDPEAPGASRLSRFRLRGTSEGRGRFIRRTVFGTYPLSYERVRLVIIGLKARPKRVRLHGGSLLDELWDEETRRLTLRCRVGSEFAVELG